MAVAHVVSSASHASGSFSVNQASFSWTHTTSTDPQGVLLFVFQGVGSTDAVTSVTYDGVTVPVVSGGRATDTATELGSCAAYFLGSGVPATNNPTVQVNRANNPTTMWAVAVTVTAAADTATAGVVLLQENGTLAVQSVDDGSVSGTNSVRYAGAYYGGASPAPAGTGSTLLHSDDAGAYGWSAVRETTAGQGARNVGFTQATSDDRAAVHIAVREVVPPVTGTGEGVFGFAGTSSGVPIVQGAASGAFGFDAAASGSATGGGGVVSFVDQANTGTDALVSSRSVNKPAAVASGDVAVFQLTRWNESSSFPAVTPPSGVVARTPIVQGLMETIIFLDYVESESSWNFTWASSRWSTLKALFFTGVDSGLDLSTVPLDSAQASSGTSVTTTTVTTVADAGLAWFVNTADYGGATTHAPPTNFTEPASFDHDPSSGAYRISPGDGSQSASGATISSSQAFIAVLVALAPAAGGGTTVEGAATGAFGFTGAAVGIPTTPGNAAGSFGFTAAAAGVDRAVGAAVASFGFTGTASGTVGTPPVTGTAAGVFGFAATADGVPRTPGTATGTFGFTATAAGIDRAVGAAAATLGFVGAAAGVDRSIGAAAGSFGFAAAAAGVPEIFAVAVAVFGFTGTAQGFAGTPPVTGEATGAFGFTSTAQGQPRTPGAAVASFGFTGSALGRPRVLAVVSGGFGFIAVATGERSTTGSGQGSFGFVAVIAGTVIPPVVYGTATAGEEQPPTARLGAGSAPYSTGSTAGVPTSTGA